MYAYICCEDDSPVTVFHKEENAVEWVKDRVFTKLYLKQDWEYLFHDMTDDEIMDEGSNNDIYYLIVEYGDEEQHCCNCEEKHEEVFAVEKHSPEDHDRFSFKKL